jgi:arginase
MKTSKIRLLGLPTDINSSFERGAAKAPPVIREALWSDRANLSTELGSEIGVDIQINDDGDLPLNETADDDALITAAVAAIIEGGGVPLCLGGDHSVTYPVVQAIAARYGAISILHFDAHPDIYHDFGGNPRSHASPFARIMEAGLATRLVQVGIRTANRHCREQADRFSVEMIEMKDFSVDRVPIIPGPLYISLDIDALDPAFAPGVAHPEPGGLSVRDIIDVLHRQTSSIVGADLVEYIPDRDQNGIIAIVAAKLLRECAAVITCNNIKGDSHDAYRSPLE